MHVRKTRWPNQEQDSEQECCFMFKPRSFHALHYSVDAAIVIVYTSIASVDPHNFMWGALYLTWDHPMSDLRSSDLRSSYVWSEIICIDIIWLLIIWLEIILSDMRSPLTRDHLTWDHLMSDLRVSYVCLKIIWLDHHPVRLEIIWLEIILCPTWDHLTWDHPMSDLRSSDLRSS